MVGVGSDGEVERKGGYSPERSGVLDETAYLEDVSPHHTLHRGLKARQVAMIAIGGAIGTGLIIGT